MLHKLLKENLKLYVKLYKMPTIHEQALRQAFSKAKISATWKEGHSAKVVLNRKYNLSVLFADIAFDMEDRRDLVAETGLKNKKGDLIFNGDLGYDDVIVWHRAADVARHIIALRKRLHSA